MADRVGEDAQAVVAGALAGPLLRQYVSAGQWLGLCLGLAGVALVTTADAAASSGVAWWTYLIPFAGMLSLVAATFLDQRSRTPVPPTVSMTVHCTTSAVVFTTAALATGTAAPPSAPSFWLAITWLVTLSTFGGYGLYWLVLQRSGITKVNTLMFLMAPVTAIWGAAMFDEPFTAQTAIGLAVALAAVAVVHTTDRRAGPRVRGMIRRTGPRPASTSPGSSRTQEPASTAPSMASTPAACSREPRATGRVRRGQAVPAGSGTGRSPRGR